ncbi:MAG: RluA family pseudouridine synthase [Bacteroidales bacterium]|nr:RluA family pseudouridine synthase [Bacteroidales bacterium]
MQRETISMMTLPEQILYEDNHLIILNKQAGQIVQSDKTEDPCMSDDIKAFLKERDHKPGNVFCGTVHRLDRPVSGVVIFAKTDKALSRMNEIIKKRLIKKTYWAITKKAPKAPQGHLQHWLLRNEAQNKTYVVGANTDGAKEAELNYRVISKSQGGYYLIEVDLVSGRHHQIRAQLAHVGCPIRGDLKYGYPRSNSDGGISLHSRSVTFEHPVRHEMLTVTAPTPDDKMWSIFPIANGASL